MGALAVRAGLVLCAAVLSTGAWMGPPPDSSSPDLGVRVVFASGALFEDDLADQLSVVLVDELRRRECFRSVAPVESDDRGPGSAVLKVRVDEHWTRTISEIGIVRQQRAEHPDDRLRYAVEESLSVEVGLLIPGSEEATFSKPFRTKTLQRPRFEGDDPVRRARAEVLDHFAERVATLACKGRERRN